MKPLSLNVSKTINAPIEKVFDAWLDPIALSKFMLPMPIMPQPKVKIDPVQGGQFEILDYATLGMDFLSSKLTHCRSTRYIDD